MWGIFPKYYFPSCYQCAWTLNLFLLGFISSLPQLAWEKRLCCCCITFLHASIDWNRHIIKWDQVSNRRCLNSAQTTTAHSTGQSKAWTYVHSCTWTNKNLQPLFHYSDIFPSHMLQSDAGHWCEVTKLFSEWGKMERKARRMAWPANL